MVFSSHTFHANIYCMSADKPRQHRLFADDPDPWELDAAADREAVRIVFPEAPYGPYDYEIPDKLRGVLQPGVRVKVPLGRGNRLRLGYCQGVQHRSLHSQPLKPVAEVIDKTPLVSPTLWKLAEWIAGHYLCPLGQVLEAVVPSGVREQAGTREATFLSVSTAVAARLSTLQLPPKQMQALQILAAAARPLTPPELATAAQCTLAPIQELRKKKLIIASLERIQSVSVEMPVELKQEHLKLEGDQHLALQAILQPMAAGRHETILLHGVTGSGKTEVYIQAIVEVLKYRRQAIVLVPEISLTPQTRQRFRSRFERVAVLHSHLSPAERHWHWQQIAAGDIDVVVGARSAVFAPTPQLGLIIIDEEHEPSFKQDSLPRYHTRDVALFRTRAENVPLVLGSATPSLESWQAAKASRFRLVDMPKRVNNLPLPDVGVIDLRYEVKSNVSRGAISRPLQNAMKQTLAEQGQIILLLNRRGFSTHIQCPACGFVSRCPNCEISLTHHRHDERLKCHYCEYEAEPPARCPDCKFDGIRYSGLGTEKLEFEVKAKFPGAEVLRMDSDTMRKPGSHEAALAKFRAGEVHILLGTQMIAKGLDFPNVMLVGVVNADTSLHFPDFRAAERTFQLVTQVAGRTGRGSRGGHVLVQTFSPEHPAIQAAVQHDFVRFAEYELPIRAEFGYPPHRQLARWIIRGEREDKTREFAELLAETLRSSLAAHAESLRILGPAPCPMAKLRNQFRFHILLTVDDLDLIHATLGECLKTLPSYDDIQWIVDIDPQDLL
jgi:primosomal protein N' (replication factor Y) (superfamily II helicase)